MIQLKAWIALGLVVSFAVAVEAQENKCTTKLADLPAAKELSGFKLGMTPAQVKARVPQVLFGRTDSLGVSKTTINPYFDPKIDKTGFDDVRSVSLDFLDGRLTSLWIGFEGTFKWKTVDEFVKGISAALAVPDQWTPARRGQQLKCADFQLDVSMIGGGPSLRVLDSGADETLVARRQAMDDEAAEADASVFGDSKTRFYYPVDCELLKTVPEKNRVKFQGSEEAERAGYKRASDCP